MPVHLLERQGSLQGIWCNHDISLETKLAVYVNVLFCMVRNRSSTVQSTRKLLPHTCMSALVTMHWKAQPSFQPTSVAIEVLQQAEMLSSKLFAIHFAGLSLLRQGNERLYPS